MADNALEITSNTSASSETVVPKKRLRRDGSPVPRDRILQIAARLFREKGYKGTTVRDIALEVGVQSGSLFHHFSSKEEILLAIMREAFLSVCIGQERILSETSDPVEQLRSLLRLELDAIVSDVKRDYHAVLYFDWREAPEQAKPELNRYRKRYQGNWLQALDACCRQGKLRCESDIAEHILNGALRGVMTWFKKSGRYSIEELVETFLRLFLA